MNPYNYDLISEDFYNQNQSWHFVLTVNIENKRIRIKIDRNAYDNQSSLTGFLWNGNEWKQVDYHPLVKSLNCFHVSYVDKKPNKLAFRLDAEFILDRVCEIVL